MSPRDAASTLGKLGAERRHQAEREPIRAVARAMREAKGMPPHPGLYPPLILGAADRI